MMVSVNFLECLTNINILDYNLENLMVYTTKNALPFTQLMNISHSKLKNPSYLFLREIKNNAKTSVFMKLQNYVKLRLSNQYSLFGSSTVIWRS